MDKLRNDVAEFTTAMEQKLQFHDDVRGDIYRCMTDKELLERLKEELGEVENNDYFRPLGTIMDELIDVANFAMMLYSNMGRRIK